MIIKRTSAIIQYYADDMHLSVETYNEDSTPLTPVSATMVYDSNEVSGSINSNVVTFSIPALLSPKKMQCNVRVYTDADSSGAVYQLVASKNLISNTLTVSDLLSRAAILDRNTPDGGWGDLIKSAYNIVMSDISDVRGVESGVMTTGNVEELIFLKSVIIALELLNLEYYEGQLDGYRREYERRMKAVSFAVIDENQTRTKAINSILMRL